MTLAQTIHQHVVNFPPDKQAEVLDFILFLEHKPESGEAREKTAVPHCRLRDEPAIGIWQDRQDMQDSSEWVRNLRRTA